MKPYTIPLGPLAANCYVIPAENDRCVLIDIGEGTQKLRTLLESRGLTPAAILLTHGHYDHVAGVEEIRRLYQCPVYIHEADENMLRSGQANLAYQLTARPFQPVQSYTLLRGGDTLSIAGLEIRVMHTPGHTAGGVCYCIEEAMFTGDTLFAGSIGRIDLGGNAQDMRASLAMLCGIAEDYTVYPGHFNSSTLHWEQTHNGPMRCI